MSLGQLNMRLTLWTSALVAVVARLSTSSLHNITGPFLPLPEGSQHVKRWYGVPEGEKTMIRGGWGPWPVMCKEPEPVQAIRYCFKDKRSADNLQSTVDQVSVHFHAARSRHPEVSKKMPLNEKLTCIAQGRSPLGPCPAPFYGTHDLSRQPRREGLQ